MLGGGGFYWSALRSKCQQNDVQFSSVQFSNKVFFQCISSCSLLNIILYILKKTLLMY